MYNHPMTRKALIDSVSAIAYIIAISIFLYFGQGIFGAGKSILAPITMLSLLVLSAGVTGSLVFGRSVLWYLDGNKKDAIVLLFYKFVIIFVFIVILLTILLVS